MSTNDIKHTGTYSNSDLNQLIVQNTIELVFDIQ